MRPGVKLHRDCAVSQRAGVVMRRIGTDHYRLTYDRRSQGNDLRALLAFTGPTDLTFFSSAIDRDPTLLEGGVTQDGLYVFGILRLRHGAARAGADEFHVNAFRLEKPMILGDEPGQTEHRTADFTDHFFHVAS